MKKISLILLLSLLLVLPCFAKVNITVQGTVYGKHKAPLIGALIKDKEGRIIATTDIEGQFLLTVEEGTQVEVTALGYTPKKVKLKSIQTAIYMSDDDDKKFAVKPYGEFNVTKYFKPTSDLFSIYADPKSLKFGVDFGYRFFNKKGMALEANVGLGYKELTTDFSLYNNFSYHYYASPYADIDGESYERYYDLYWMGQRVKTQYFSVPVYLTYSYTFAKRVGIYFGVGANFDIKMKSMLESGYAAGASYGIYPQYGDLKIDDPAINDFGDYWYAQPYHEEAEANSTVVSLMATFGVEVYIWGPLSLDASARFYKGLGDVYPSDWYTPGSITEQDAPVIYTVRNGQILRPITNYMDKSILNQLNIRIGLNFRF